MTLSNIPKLVLDPQNEAELTQLAYNRIQTASGNTITDFRPGSAIAALVEGQTFALAELLYYLNLMPEAIAIEVFKLYGIQRSLGTPASGELTFTLQSATQDLFILPSGYQIAYLDTQFTLQNTLVIGVGNTEATVPVVCSDVGSRYNANAYNILLTSVGLGKVKSVFNRKALTGGSDIETIDNLVARCQASTVSRSSIITRLDYELAAQAQMGVGSRAVVLPNLGADGSTFRLSSIGLFLLDSTGKPASATTCANIRTALIDRIIIGTDLNCFPAELNNISVEVFCNVRSISDALGKSIIDTILAYMNPVTFNGGQQLRHNELEYVARKVEGVTSVDSVLMNGDAIDLLAPRRYSFFNPDSISVSMMDNNGISYTVYGGLGVDGDTN